MEEFSKRDKRRRGRVGFAGGFHWPGRGCSSSKWKGLDLKHPHTVFACAHTHVHTDTPARARACTHPCTHPPLHAPVHARTPAPSHPGTLTSPLRPHPTCSPAPRNGRQQEQRSLPGRGSCSRTHGRAPGVPRLRRDGAHPGRLPNGHPLVLKRHPGCGCSPKGVRPGLRRSQEHPGMWVQDSACPQRGHPHGKTLGFGLSPAPKLLGTGVSGRWCRGMP